MHKENWAHAVEGSRCITFPFCKKYLPKTRMSDLKNSQIRIGKCPGLWPWVTSWRTRPGRKHSGLRTLWRFGRDLQCFRGLPCHVMATVTLHSVFAFRIILQGWNDVRQCQPPLSRQKLRCKLRREKPPTFLSSHHQICTRTSTGIPVKILHCKFLRISSTKSGISQICFAGGTWPTVL